MKWKVQIARWHVLFSTRSSSIFSQILTNRRGEGSTSQLQETHENNMQKTKQQMTP